MRCSNIRTISKHIIRMNLSTAERMILLAVNIFGDGGRDRIDERFIADAAGLSNSVAEIIISDLRSKGLLSFVTVEKKGTTYNHHSLTASFLSSIEVV